MLRLIMAYNEHYVKNCATIQIIDVIEVCPFILGSLLKYMTRYGSKDDVNQELSKIYDYLNRCLIREDDIELISWWQNNKKLVAFFEDIFEDHGFIDLNYKGSLLAFLESIKTCIKDEFRLHNGC